MPAGTPLEVSHTPPGQLNAVDTDAAVRAFLSRILEGSDLPALSRQIIDAISALDDDASSLQRLANVVLREYSLTVSVVRTANSVHYRRSGRPVQSATHAMMLLGARTVRELATGLLLFENYQKRSAGLRELMLLSLLTANHARETAIKLGVADPGEAHLCGMFRNLGEVLVACHAADEYAQIHHRITSAGEGESRACARVLGFQFVDLGVEVCRQWGMPSSVAEGMRARANAASSQVSAITSFSHDLTNALYRRDGAGTNPNASVTEVLERYAPRLKLTQDQAREIVEASLTETRELFLSAHVSIDALRMQQLSEAAHSALGVESPPVPSAELASNGDDVESRNVLRTRLAQELAASVDPASGRDVGAVLLLALEAVLRGAPFDRAIACVLNADRTRLTARAGLGTDVEALMAKFDFPMTARGGPITAVLHQRSSLYLPVDRAMNLVELRWTLGSGIAQFGVFPIAVSGTVIGCLYCDRLSMASVPDRDTLHYVGKLVELVMRAIEERRKAASAASPQPLDAAAKSALVLRLLRGDSIEAVALETGVPRAQLESWRTAFLAGAMERLAGQ
jgi:HD-like signal output (HDOD) protein